MLMRRLVAASALAAVLGVTGCQHTSNRSYCQPAGGCSPSVYAPGGAVRADPNVPPPPVPTQTYAPPTIYNGRY